ncbi:class I SAM-dependent methyltransferase [Tsuneonella sp. HG222]
MEVRDWQGRTGDSWAAEWKRTDRSFGGLTERLLARTRDFPMRDVVDIGCGAGELSLAIGRGRPEVQVTGVDLSPQLVAVARERGAHHGNVSFVEADAAAWRPEQEGVTDMVVSRHGVMFFADPVAAFANIAGYVSPRANLLFSCFRPLAENPAFSELGKLLPPPASPPDPRAPGPFAFADREYVRGILEAAGWGDVRFEAFDFAMIAGAGDDPVGDALSYFTRIGAAAAPLAEMNDAERQATLEKIRHLARQNCRDGVVALRAGAWLVTAQRA